MIKMGRHQEVCIATVAILGLRLTFMKNYFIQLQRELAKCDLTDFKPMIISIPPGFQGGQKWIIGLKSVKLHFATALQN